MAVRHPGRGRTRHDPHWMMPPTGWPGLSDRLTSAGGPPGHAWIQSATMSLGSDGNSGTGTSRPAVTRKLTPPTNEAGEVIGPDLAETLAKLDTSVPHPARRYNYWLGGKDNFAVDRESGDRIVEMFPTVRLAAQENRMFQRRAV